MNTTGGVGGDGLRAHGADGVAAYGYAYSTHKFYDDADASEYVHAVSGYAVSPGGGAGYGGGSSGGVLALGMQKYDEHSGEVYAIGMGVTMGGGGSGDSYVSPEAEGSSIIAAGTGESGYLELMARLCRNQVLDLLLGVPSCGFQPHTGEALNPTRISCPANGMKYGYTPMTCFTPSVPVFKLPMGGAG